MFRNDYFRCLKLPDCTPEPVPEHLFLALGNFDGVHLAHRAMLLEMKKQQQNPEYANYAVAVFCFEKDSDEYLSDNPRHLTTLDEKLKYFYEEGQADYALVADFEKCRSLTAEAFENMLSSACPHLHLFFGRNFRYGENATGTAVRMQQRFPGCVHIMYDVTFNGERISATRIREVVARGDVALALQMMGRPYTLTNIVTTGKQLGRTLGFPTANTEIPEKMVVPAFGVYVTKVTLPDNSIHRGLTNVGDNPTVEKGIRPRLETYLLDYSGDLYGKKISVSFLDKIRDEKTFSSIEELQEQMKKDLRFVQNYEE